MSMMPYYYNSDLEALAGILIAELSLGGLIGLVFYIFNALGLYGLSKNRGYKNAWISFIPLVNNYVLGGLADNINLYRGKKSHHRVTLLILSIVSALSAVITFATLISFVFDIIRYASYSYFDEAMLVSLVGRMLLVLFLVCAAAVAQTVFTAICWYKVYQDYSNGNEVLFLILSILFGIAPFFLFALRKKPAKSMSYAGGYQQPPTPPYSGGTPYSPYQPGGNYYAGQQGTAYPGYQPNPMPGNAPYQAPVQPNPAEPVPPQGNAPQPPQSPDA
jgi:glucan phosphoethanolaminetransferase (alkaline phosphatase superfamily)